MAPLSSPEPTPEPPRRSGRTAAAQSGGSAVAAGVTGSSNETVAPRLTRRALLTPSLPKENLNDIIKLNLTLEM